MCIVLFAGVAKFTSDVKSKGAMKEFPRIVIKSSRGGISAQSLSVTQKKGK